MRVMRGMVAGALALGGLIVMQGEASAQPTSAPELIHVTAVGPDMASAGMAAQPCYYGWHRHWHGPYGWHRPFYHPHRFYGWHRPWGWHRHFGWHRHWR